MRTPRFLLVWSAGEEEGVVTAMEEGGGDSWSIRFPLALSNF